MYKNCIYAIKITKTHQITKTLTNIKLKMKNTQMNTSLKYE